MKKWAPVIVLWLLTAALTTWVHRELAEPLPEPDVVMVNDVVNRAQTQWATLASNPGEFPPGADITILDTTRTPATVLFSRGGQIDDDLEAVRRRAAALDVVVGGERVGRAYVVDASADAARERLDRLSTWLTWALIAAAVMATSWWIWVVRRVLAPFDRMRVFAAELAKGNFNVPLRMDRAQQFGAFTESLDLMREELARSAEREETLRLGRKTLVAQLSHDIRTPLASIEATTELLSLDERNLHRKGRLEVVLAKSRQIGQLVADLFQANEVELERLPVSPRTHSSTELAHLCAAADPDGALTRLEIPDCLVVYDDLRMQQVLDNVMVNAAKYARTPVEITGSVDGHLLALHVRDHGPGVPEDELALIVTQHGRGSNSAGVLGNGLGLFTSAWLMERMGGSLTCRTLSDGFVVVLELPMAGGEADPAASSGR